MSTNKNTIWLCGEVIGKPILGMIYTPVERLSMDLIGELQDLQKKAMLFTTITDRERRWNGGFVVEHQARQLEEQYRITDGNNEEAKVELAAVLTLVFDFLLYDKLEDSDWIEALPDHYDGDIDALVQGVKRDML